MKKVDITHADRTFDIDDYQYDDHRYAMSSSLIRQRTARAATHCHAIFAYADVVQSMEETCRPDVARKYAIHGLILNITKQMGQGR